MVKKIDKTSYVSYSEKQKGFLKNKEKFMKIKKESLVLGRIFQKIAPQIGATVILEPMWGIAGQITFKDGSRSYFRYNTLDINPMGSSEIAKDKGYSNFFMELMGYPVVPGSETFFSNRWAKQIGSLHQNIDAGYRHACKLGFPVIVKPNSGSQGSGVALVYNRREFYRAMCTVFDGDRVALVQKPVHGKDYRLVVLDKKVISAYERIPLSIVGDGESTIVKLLELKQEEFMASNRDTQIKMDDPRITTKLNHQEMNLKSVPGKGQKIYLLDNANLSTGGDSVDITEKVHPAFRKLAVNISRDMGLRLCGVDLIVDGNISQKPRTWWFLEVNSAPGLDHYSKSGKAQEQIVEQLYLEVLKNIEKKK